MIDKAKRAQYKALWTAYWVTCVKLNERLTSDKRIVFEALIKPRILDDEYIVLQYCMGAERRPGCLCNYQSMSGLEPQTLRIDKRHNNNWHVE